MTNRLLIGVSAVGLLLAFGWGCIKNTDISSDGTSATPTGDVQGVADFIPDGKGGVPFELCVNTEAWVSGPVWLYAANNTKPRLDWKQWFSASPVASGDAFREICGPLNFDVQTGDKLYVNGMWANKKYFLVNNQGTKGAASDDIKEIWLDDQFYEIGKDCVYENNNMKGYNLVCVVR